MSYRKIAVAQAHIDAGERKSECDCPVALAVQDSFDEHATVDECSICVEGYAQVMADTPPDVMEFISDFDDGKPVEPFVFEADFGESYFE